MGVECEVGLGLARLPAEAELDVELAAGAHEPGSAGDIVGLIADPRQRRPRLVRLGEPVLDERVHERLPCWIRARLGDPRELDGHRRADLLAEIELHRSAAEMRSEQRQELGGTRKVSGPADRLEPGKRLANRYRRQHAQRLAAAMRDDPDMQDPPTGGELLGRSHQPRQRAR
jgi:hypothetical protein